MNPEEMNQCLANLKNQIDKFKNLKFATSNGETPNSNMEEMQKMADSIYNSMYNALDYCHDRIDKCQASLDQHKKGHLPPAKTPSQMESWLEILGVSEDYEVSKNYISLAKTRQGMVATASYIKNESSKI